MAAFQPSRPEVLGLLRSAVRAPSADNRSHLRFSIDDAGVSLLADAEFLACGADHQRTLMMISFGAAAENLRLGLADAGWAFVPRWFPDASAPSLVLRLDWAHLAPTEKADPLFRFIESRHTNRRLFRGPRLSASDAALLETAVRDVPSVALDWFDAKPRRQALLRLMRLAESERFRVSGLHAELFESIDFAAGWDATTPERLAPATLEVERFLRMPFASMRHWSVMRAMNAVGANRALGFRVGDLPARTAPHLGVLSSTLELDAAALSIGQAFQRLWLAADSQGLALQPMVASAVLALGRGAEGARERTRDALNQGWRALLGESTPLVVFRLGRARKPRVVSGRQPVETYLV